jgi:hypothetical protein
MNLLGGLKVRWRALLMFYVLCQSLLLFKFSHKTPFNSSFGNPYSICIKAYTYHNVGVTMVKQK